MNRLSVSIACVSIACVLALPACHPAPRGAEVLSQSRSAVIYVTPPAAPSLPYIMHGSSTCTLQSSGHMGCVAPYGQAR